MPTADDSGALSPPVGAMLRAARESRGLSVPGVAERARIPETLVEQIEHDDFAGCGGDFFARGHVRSLAVVVGLDAGRAVRRFDEVHVVPEPPPKWATPRQAPARPADAVPAAPASAKFVPPPPPTFEDVPRARRPGGSPSAPVRPPAPPARAVPPAAGRPAVTAVPAAMRKGGATAVVVPRRPSGPSWKLPLAVAFGIVALGAVVFAIASLRTPHKPAARALPPSSAPASAASATPAAPAGIDLQLRVRPGQSSFVRVTDGSGRQLFQGTLSGQAVKDFRDPKKIMVDYANSRAFTVVLNGKDLGPPSCNSIACVLQYEPA